MFGPGNQAKTGSETTYCGFGASEFLPLPAEFDYCRYAVLRLEGWNYAQG